MAIMLKKQKHHISNKCTSSPASMSIFTGNIQATQTTSALQQKPRQPRHVEYALQPNTTAPHQVHSPPDHIAAHHFTISQLSLSTSSSLPPCPCNLCLRWYIPAQSATRSRMPQQLVSSLTPIDGCCILVHDGAPQKTCCNLLPLSAWGVFDALLHMFPRVPILTQCRFGVDSVAAVSS